MRAATINDASNNIQPQYTVTENRQLSWCQLYRHWPEFVAMTTPGSTSADQIAIVTTGSNRRYMHTPKPMNDSGNRRY